MKRLVFLFISTLLIFTSLSCFSQFYGDFDHTRAEVDFSRVLCVWDGFGFNYVEVPQTLDYEQDPQEYGGFSLLTEPERQEICDLIFGDDGLKPGLLKMFYDPWHQKSPDAPFDHETTTKWMRYFVREGMKRSITRGDSITIITTLYGPPPWATRQKFLRGRDLDPSMKYNPAKWVGGDPNPGCAINIDENGKYEVRRGYYY